MRKRLSRRSRVLRRPQTVRQANRLHRIPPLHQQPRQPTPLRESSPTPTQFPCRRKEQRRALLPGLICRRRIGKKCGESRLKRPRGRPRSLRRERPRTLRQHRTKGLARIPHSCGPKFRLETAKLRLNLRNFILKGTACRKTASKRASYSWRPPKSATQLPSRGSTT